ALAVRALDLAELRGEHHLLARALERPAEQLLVVAPAVHVRGVQEVDAQVQRVVDDVDGLGVIALAVGARHGHAPESDGRDLQVAVAQLAILHGGRISRVEGSESLPTLYPSRGSAVAGVPLPARPGRPSVRGEADQHARPGKGPVRVGGSTGAQVP